MATPRSMAKRSIRQTAAILEAVQGLALQVAELQAEVAELKAALKPKPAARRTTKR